MQSEHMKKLLFTIHLFFSFLSTQDAAEDEGGRQGGRAPGSWQPTVTRKGTADSGHGQPWMHLAFALAGCSQQPLGSGSKRRLTGMASMVMFSRASLARGRYEEALEGRGAGLGAQLVGGA